MLLGSSPNRRLVKEETQSPAMADAPANAPCVPGKTDDRCGADRQKNACDKAAPGLGAPEQWMTIAKDQSAVYRTSRARAEEALEQKRRAVRGYDQDKTLQDRSGVDRHRDVIAPTPVNDKQSIWYVDGVSIGCSAVCIKCEPQAGYGLDRIGSSRALDA